MTSPGINKPSDQVNGYEQVHSAGTRFGQDLSEAKVRSLLSGRVVNPFERFTNGLIGGITDSLKGLVPIGSVFRPVQDAYQDRQSEVQYDLDLLSNLLDYGSCYAPNDYTRIHGNGFVNFSRQIGPMRGCHLEGDKLVLDSKGLWDIRAHVVMDAFLGIIDSGAFANISVRVYTNTDELYSSQTFAVSGSQTTSAAIISSVVVPRPGFYVRVYVENPISRRGILAGPRWSRLTAQHITNSADEGGTGSENSTQPTEEE